MPLPRIYETPDDLWNDFQKYFDDTKANPIIKIEQRKGSVIIPKNCSPEDFAIFSDPKVKIPMERPLTVEGFERFVGHNLTNYFINYKGMYSDLQDVCRKIKNTIRADQIEGGMVMIYSPMITARLTGLVEKTATELSIEQPLFPEKDKELAEGEKPMLGDGKIEGNNGTMIEPNESPILE